MHHRTPITASGDLVDSPCACPDPALCRLLNRHIHGRLWEIWNGINIDSAQAEAYRDLWRRTAAEMPAVEKQPRPRCRHRGADEVELVSCPSCGKDVRGLAQFRIKVFACAVYGKCTEARKLESIAGCCTACPSYEAATPVEEDQTTENRTV